MKHRTRFGLSLAGALLLAGTVQNHGCLPWQEALHVGGSTFDEGGRGHTVCR